MSKKYFSGFLSILFVIQLFGGFLFIPQKVYSTSPPWTQTDWSGGSGQTGLVDSTRFSSSSNINTSIAGQLSLQTNSGWYSTSWKYRRKITFDNSAQAENLADFPILVKLDSTRIDYSNTQDLGEDIRFADSDGATLLSYEIEKWDETGSSYVWVKVPQIDASSNTDYIYVYYGNTDASDGQAATSVWDSSYKAVWHLKESGNGTADEYKDSTSNANHARGGGGTVGSVPTLNSSGQINGAQLFDGAVADDDFIQTPLAPSGYSAITMSAWVKLDLADNYPMVLSYGTNADNNPEMRFFNTSGRIEFVRRVDNNGPGDTVDVSGTGWRHFVGMANGSSLTLYKDGAFLASSTFAHNIDSITPLRIGGRSDGGFTFTGSIDEVRVSSIVRSAAWVAASYKSETDTFNTYASQEERYVSSGTLTSSIFDTEQLSNWGTLTYATDGVATTTVKARTSSSSSMAGATDFGSCDAITSGTDISTNNCVTDTHRYVQYQIALTSVAANTPIFQDASVAFTASDTTAPSISLTALSPDPNNDNTPSLSGTATDAAGTVSAVQFQMDATSSSWTACAADDGSFDSATEVFHCDVSSALSDGSHTIYVRATDAAENTTSDVNASTDTFTIDTTAPAVSITAPADLAIVSGSAVAVTASATDAVGVVGVQFKLDGANLGAEDATSTYGVTWDSTSASEGSHTLSAVASDAAGNSTTTSAITVTVDNIVIPTLVTSDASSVATSTLTLNGSISATGGEDATQSGFTYGTDITLAAVIATSTLGAQSGTASFTENLTGLTPNTRYYFRAYATNSAGTGYGSIVSTTTVALTAPTITTSAASSVTDTAATLNGSIDALGGENATARGFEWGHTTAYNATTTESGSHSAGSFVASLSSLTCATEYHFRGYAINSAGTGYGADQTFTTSACPVVTPPPSSGGGGGGGGGGFSPPSPRAPEGGYVFFITPHPTTNGYVTLHFYGGEEITTIAIADNPDFSSALYAPYTTSYSWLLSGAGEHMLYVKFCNQYGSCGERVSAKAIYTPPLPTPPDIQTGFIDNFIPSFLKKQLPPKPAVEPPVIKEAPPLSLEGGWKLLSNSLIYNFVLAPLPSDTVKLTEKFPELGKVFADLGIVKISDLDKLKNANINLPVLADEQKLPSEILMAKGSQGLIALNSSLAVTAKGEVQQKIKTIAGERIILSVRPESQAESVKGYLLFKRQAERTVMEIPENSLVAGVFLASIAEVAKVSSSPPTIEQELLVQSFEYTDPNHDGIYTAETTAPAVEGEYEVLVVINYMDQEKGSKELRMITVVDPEGYVYRSSNGEETRISNVKVSIFSIASGKEFLWDASKYNQENPRVTDRTGRYSFLVPPGRYYITAEAKGYKPYHGDDFDVQEDVGIHFNIELMENKSALRALLDWKMLAILIFGAGLVVNFLNDRRLRKQLSIK